jgi:hypothetical protein
VNINLNESASAALSIGTLCIAVAAIFVTVAFGSAQKTVACHQAQTAAYAASAVPPRCP